MVLYIKIVMLVIYWNVCEVKRIVSRIVFDFNGKIWFVIRVSWFYIYCFDDNVIGNVWIWIYEII